MILNGKANEKYNVRYYKLNDLNNGHENNSM